MRGDVIDIGHGEQRQVRGCTAALLRRLGEVVQDRLVVTHCCGQHTQPWGSARHARQLDGRVCQRGEGNPSAPPVTDTAASGQNRWYVSGHSLTVGVHLLRGQLDFVCALCSDLARDRRRGLLVQGQRSSPRTIIGPRLGLGGPFSFRRSQRSRGRRRARSRRRPGTGHSTWRRR